MAVSKKLTLKGLVTYSSQTSTIEGALQEAHNILLDKPGTAMPRPGFNYVPYTTYSAVPLQHPTNAEVFSDKVVFTTKDSRLFGAPFALGGLGTLSEITSGSDTTIRGDEYVEFAKGNKNLYGTSSLSGPWVWDGTGPVEMSGIPKAFNPEIINSANSVAAGGFAPAGTEIAYRIVYGYRDDNNNLILGAPSDRVTYIVQAGGAGVFYPKLTIYTPARIPGDLSSWFVQIYKTLMSSAPTEGNSGDNMQLAYETDLYTGVVSSFEVQDIYTDGVLGAALYTNTTQEGISQANSVPPVCTSMAAYNNYIAYANCKQTVSASFTFTGVPAEGAQFALTAGKAASSYYQSFLVKRDAPTASASKLILNARATLGNQFTVGGVQYTAPCLIGTDYYVEFKRETGGTEPQNIANTARNFCAAVTKYMQSPGIVAWYSSTALDLPGKFIIYSMFPDTGFTLQSSIALSMFITPSLPDIAAGAGEVYAPDSYPNRVYFSKLQESESVPYSNYFDVGDANDVILTVKAVKDALYVIKKTSIWRIIGETLETMSLSLVRSYITTSSAKTVKVLGDYVYGHADVGIYRISGSSITIISDSILDVVTSVVEDELLSWTDDANSLYFLSGITNSRIIVYDERGDNFVTWDLPKYPTCGLYSQNQLFLGCVSTANPEPTATRFGGFMVSYIDLYGYITAEEKYGDGDFYTTFSVTDVKWLRTVSPTEVYYSFDISVPASKIFYLNEAIVLMSSVTARNKQFLITKILGTNKVEVRSAAYHAFPLVGKYAFVNEPTDTVTVTHINNTTFTIQTDDIYKYSKVKPGDYLVESLPGGTPVTILPGKARVVQILSSTSLLIELLQSPYNPDPTNTPWGVSKRGVTSVIEFWPFYGEGPEVYKDFKEIAAIYPRHPYGPMTLTYSTDLTAPQTYLEYQYTSAPIGWGNFNWGVAPWGEAGDISEEVERSIAPIVLDKGHKLKYKWEVTTSNCIWEFTGISLQYRNINFTSVRGGQ